MFVGDVKKFWVGERKESRKEKWKRRGGDGWGRDKKELRKRKKRGKSNGPWAQEEVCLPSLPYQPAGFGVSRGSPGGERAVAVLCELGLAGGGGRKKHGMEGRSDLREHSI